MLSLELKHLGVVDKFLGLRIMLDSEDGYVLEQGVVTDLLLKANGLESTNGVRTPTEKECNAERTKGSELLVASSEDILASIKGFSPSLGVYFALQDALSLLSFLQCTAQSGRLTIRR